MRGRDLASAISTRALVGGSGGSNDEGTSTEALDVLTVAPVAVAAHQPRRLVGPTRKAQPSGQRSVWVVYVTVGRLVAEGRTDLG